MLGPAERIHTQQLKERDTIESEPARKKRDKRKNVSGHQPQRLVVTFQQPELSVPEVDLDLSNPSMPPLSNFTEKEGGVCMAAEVFSKQHIRRATLDAKASPARDSQSPNEPKRRQRNTQLISSLDSVESSVMENSAHMSGQALQADDSGGKVPDWFSVGQQISRFNDIHKSDSQEEPCPNMQVKPARREHGDGRKTRIEFESLGISVDSADLSLGGSSKLI